MLLLGFGTLEWGVLIAAVVVVAIWWGKRRRDTTAGRLINAGRAQVSRWGHAAEDADPVAGYQQIIDDATEELRTKQGVIDEFGGKVETQIRQVDRLVNEEGTLKRELDTRVNRAKELQVAPPNESDADRMKREELLAKVRTSGANKMEEHKRKMAERVAAEGMLAQFRAAHDQALADLSAINEKVEGAKRNAGNLGSQLKLADFQAESAAALSSLSSTMGSGSALSKLGEAEEKVRQAIDTKVAAAKRVQYIGRTDNFEAELDRQAASTVKNAEFDALMAAGSTAG